MKPSKFACNNDGTSISDDESELVKTNATKSSAENTERGLGLESIDGSIPERIGCAGITFDKREFLSVITPKILGI